ncbi:MAG: hypothetical protein QOF01_4917 [Thermomicrobiales bacterium]|jgi:hypothetical protein|nr:hypothetical protein [Thermomicrobiales bacterium]
MPELQAQGHPILKGGAKIVFALTKRFPERDSPRALRHSTGKRPVIELVVRSPIKGTINIVA